MSQIYQRYQLLLGNFEVLFKVMRWEHLKKKQMKILGIQY